MHTKKHIIKLRLAHKLIDQNETDFLVHVKEDTYLKVKVDHGQIVVFKTIVKGE